MGRAYANVLGLPKTFPSSHPLLDTPHDVTTAQPVLSQMLGTQLMQTDGWMTYVSLTQKPLHSSHSLLVFHHLREYLTLLRTLQGPCSDRLGSQAPGYTAGRVDTSELHPAGPTSPTTCDGQVPVRRPRHAQMSCIPRATHEHAWSSPGC